MAAFACVVGCVVGCAAACVAACAANGSMSAWLRRQTDGDRRRRRTLGAWFLLEAQARDGGGEAAAAQAGDMLAVFPRGGRLSFVRSLVVARSSVLACAPASAVRSFARRCSFVGARLRAIRRTLRAVLSRCLLSLSLSLSLVLACAPSSLAASSLSRSLQAAVSLQDRQQPPATAAAASPPPSRA